MQGSEVELGGFKGRTNKLVDGCYSWWVGGAFSLLEAVGLGAGSHEEGGKGPQKTEGESAEDWDDVDGSCVPIAVFISFSLTDEVVSYLFLSPFSLFLHS